MCDSTAKQVSFEYQYHRIFPVCFPVAILLLGEPVRWETHLQLIIDILVTNGNLLSIPQSLCKKRIPVIAANTDLIYMSEVPLPRYDDVLKHVTMNYQIKVSYRTVCSFRLVELHMVVRCRQLEK